jgi:serine/threonine protein kinase
LVVGARFGLYEILDRIGAGGMGEVYRARDTTLGREVALKVLPGPLAADEGLRQRLTREARVLASLNHPNIVTIHAVDRTDGEWFLAMELVHGRPLSELIPRNGLPLPRLLTIALAVAEAVVAAHARGILHRDLLTRRAMARIRRPVPRPARPVAGADGRNRLAASHR